MKIGNIIYEDKLVNHDELSYINYEKNTVNYDEIDNGLPTLYVGWRFMKNCLKFSNIVDRIDILNKRVITNELYWEFSFDEDKGQHINGVKKFTNNVLQYYFESKYSYINLDPIFFLINDLQDLLDVLPKKIKSVYVYKDEMLYMYSDDKITGLNLKLYEFFKFDVSEIINAVVSRSEKGHWDSDGEKYQKYYKMFSNYNKLKRFLVVILDM